MNVSVHVLTLRYAAKFLLLVEGLSDLLLLLVLQLL